jgi:hypothetical protein
MSPQNPSSPLQVRQILVTAPSPEAILSVVPALLEPRVLASVLVTVTKWYFGKEDPVAVLSRDPDLVRRAQDNDAPWYVGRYDTLGELLLAE